MKLNQTLCDACERPINADNGFVNINVLRGGFVLAVETADGTSSTKVNQTFNLCNPDCLTAYVTKTHRTAIAAAAKAKADAEKKATTAPAA